MTKNNELIIMRVPGGFIVYNNADYGRGLHFPEVCGSKKLLLDYIDLHFDTPEKPDHA